MVAVLASSVLLILAFPKFSLWPFAWIAFVPILFHLQRLKQARHAFLSFYLFGALFFLGSWEWLRHVTYFGWLFLVFSYAVYFGLFGIVTYWFLKRGHFFLSLFMIPSAWTVLEWVRTEIPVWGFGWNLLAYSQASNLDVAGIAGLFGAYGVSWIIVFANLSIFFLIHFEMTHQKSEAPVVLFSITALGLVLAFFSLYQTNRPALPQQGNVRLAVIQANIPQVIKWDSKHQSAILETYEKLTRFVSYDEKPDLIVWPEAAFPGYFNSDRARESVFRLEQGLQIPILLGAPHLDILEDGRERAYNSAYLLDRRLSLENRYDKVRLVPFGEYVPWRGFFRPIGIERFAYSLGVSDFEAGGEQRVFSLRRPDTAVGERKFSVLICFEDTFPFLARKSAERGAQFLLVVTNDAWFGKSAAPYQHLQASIFRAIENGVPVIRSANTGVSAFIDPDGKVSDRVRDKRGKDTFIVGGLVRSISLTDQITFYRKGGYQFPFYCFILMIAGMVFTFIRPSFPHRNSN
ncbi:MAG: apolipoprotein N-acyltransferase [Candidatus Omnitrophica bacterium]|nr:apolipoprotein N-acyltransferase [Candidatus Omnitrophota bacterium]